MERLEDLIQGYLISNSRWERLEHLAAIHNLLDALASKDDFGEGAVSAYAEVLKRA